MIVDAFPSPCMLPPPVSPPLHSPPHHIHHNNTPQHAPPASRKLTRFSSPLSSGGTYGIMGHMVLPMLHIAIEHINNMTTILPNVTLEARIYDHQCNAGLAIK